MGVYPALEQTLNEPRPAHLPLDLSMAHRFLQETVEVLQAGGFAVLLPAWWTQKGRQRLGLKLRIKQTETSLQDASGTSWVGLHQLMQFDACAAVGDKELNLSELEVLADLKSPLVQVHGMWTEVNPAELRRMVNFLKTRGKGEIQLGDLMHLAAERSERSQVSWVAKGQSKLVSSPLLDPLQIVDFELPTDLRDFMEGRSHVRDKEVPTGLCGQLRPYQTRGFQWLAGMAELGFGVCLADDMGLGKTVQIITWLLDERRPTSGSTNGNPALVICPTTLVGNWQREIERFAPSLRVFIHHGTNRPHGSEFLQYAKGSDVVVSTYHLAYRDYEDLAMIRWSQLVLDEAQNIKNSSGKQAQSLHRIQADKRVCITGTLVENRLDELWSLFHFLNPGYLGNAQEFRTSFSMPIERDRNLEKAQILQRLVAPFVMRRVKTDPTVIQDLPDKIEIKTYCPLTREQASIYEATVQHVLRQIEGTHGMQRRGLILASLTKLKQICNHRKREREFLCYR